MTDPNTPEALTSEWLSQSLGGTVRSFEVERFGEGAGVIGQVTRVHLNGDHVPASIIAKFPSPAPENRAVAATYDMYGREVRFYQNIASRVAMRTPRCYHASHQGDDAFVLLLEDLAGYRIGDQVAGCTANDARRVVKALARFHASAWNPDESWGLPSHNNPAQRDGMIAGFQAGWPAIMERFPDLVPESAMIAETRMPEMTAALLEEMCTAPVSISHADVRLDNIFFDDTSDDVFFVDWQSVCTSAPEQDLAYFVTQSVDPSVIAHDVLLEDYYSTLTGEGINYARDAFERRYTVSALYLLDYAVVIAGTLDLGNERGTQLARTLLGGAMRSLDAMAAFQASGGMMLKGKVAIVSAAGRGIGKAIAIKLAEAGADVVVNSYGEETTEATAQAVRNAGARALAFAADITQPGPIQACVDAAIAEFGRIDILVNNVGAGPKEGIQPEDGPLGFAAGIWDAMYRQNLRPAVLMTEAVLPHMKTAGGGKIVNISSIAGRHSLSREMLKFFTPAAYGAMKAALISHTQTMAELHGPDNINVNAVCPGIVWTDAWLGNAERAVEAIPEFNGMDPRAWFEGIARGDYPKYFDRTPLGREQTTQDIGNAVVFLASELSASITGQSLMVDGGMIKV